ncbi:MAG: 50S ribosomal protein L23 [Candidatus Aenigmatarchaeota archaeon]
MDPWKIVKHPHLSEKSIGLVERENKLVFVVNEDATKKEVKWAVEDLFDVSVTDVNTLIDMKGRKRAFISLSEDDNALDVATKLGMM